MAVEVGLADPGALELDGNDDWLSLFDNPSLDDFGEFLPEVDELEAAENCEAPGSSSPDSSSLTQSGNSSTSKNVIDFDADGSGTEQCKSDEEGKCSGSPSPMPSVKFAPKTSGSKRKLSERFDAEDRSADDKPDDGEVDEEEVKRRARLMRNRESAQLSRQRKKAYVDDLEDKVRALNATVAEMNNTITMISAENVSLRSQLAYFYHTSSTAKGNVKPPAPFPPQVGMPVYHQYPSGYVAMPPLRPGATAPPIPIPRLKTQATPAKSVKRARITKETTAAGKNKKVASFAALGFLCIMMLSFDWGVPGLQPAALNGYSRMAWTQPSRSYSGNVLTRAGGRVLMSTDGVGDSRFNESQGTQARDRLTISSGDTNQFAVSLLLPSENRVVKVNGDLVIGAVTAGNAASNARKAQHTGAQNHPVVPVNHLPALVSTIISQSLARQRLNQRALPSDRANQRALPSDRVNQRALPSPPSEGEQEQHFEGSMFNTGVCSEVFEFAISPSEVEGVPGAETNHTSWRKRSGYHRRSLAVPLPPSKKQNNSNSSNNTDYSGLGHTKSSMVVSIFTRPRSNEFEPAPKDVFVVVLVNGIKYVTYSCMLPRPPRVVTG